MKHTRKTTLLVLVSLVLATSLFANGASEKEVSSVKSKEKETLTVTMALSEEEWGVMRSKVIPDFEKANDCKVNAVQVEASDVQKKLVAMKQAGKMEIDVVASDVNREAALIDAGLVEDLSAYTDLIPAETTGKLAKAGVFDGKTFFFPYRPNAEINYYNESKFNQYGLTPPRNWDELYQVSKTLKEKENMGRICLKIKLSGDAIDLVEFIRSAGGDPLVLNDEGTIEAFSYLQKLWPELSPDTLKAGFSSSNKFLSTDEVYFCPNWPFAANIIVKDGGKKEIKAYEGFSGPKGFMKTLAGEMLGIASGSQHKDLALKFMSYMMSKDVQVMLLKENGWASFRTDTYGEAEEWQKPYFEALLKALAVAEPLPRVSNWDKIQQCLNDAGKEILLNGAEVKATLDKYALQVKELQK
ncbi:MAG: extracellular solute-binding protein [Sphaerochaetaceae bacterium]